MATFTATTSSGAMPAMELVADDGRVVSLDALSARVSVVVLTRHAH